VQDEAEMKLKKKELAKITSIYDLGKIKSVKPIPGGMINYNSTAKTDKGEFIIRKLGYKLNSWWMNKKELEFEVMEYLHKRNFPYAIPRFIKNKYGNYISNVKGNLFEVYERIPGRKIIRLNDEQFKEMVKALAIYHKIIKEYPIKKKFKVVDNHKWILDKYALMRKVKPRNKVDILMHKHLDFFENLLKKLLKFDLSYEPLVTHSDFSAYNLLWKENALIGILDFENVGYKSRVFDIAYIWNDIHRKKILVNTYRKYNVLSKRDEKYIIICRLLNSCNMFWWSYLGMEKRPELKYQWLLRTIKNGNKYFRMWK